SGARHRDHATTAASFAGEPAGVAASVLERTGGSDRGITKGPSGGKRAAAEGGSRGCAAKCERGFWAIAAGAAESSAKCATGHGSGREGRHPAGANRERRPRPRED